MHIYLYIYVYIYIYMIYLIGIYIYTQREMPYVHGTLRWRLRSRNILTVSAFLYKVGDVLTFLFLKGRRCFKHFHKIGKKSATF